MAIDGFFTLIKHFRKLLLLQKKDAFKLAKEVAMQSGIMKELYNKDTVESMERYKNLQELLNSVKVFVDDPKNENKSLESFLEHIALFTSQDEDASNDNVSLMTIHQAKGLEFKYVYILGLEENLFPGPQITSEEELEEERRLFYVGITRAQERLILSYALQRYRFGKLEFTSPSSFLDEIDLIHSDNSFQGEEKIACQARSKLSIKYLR